MNRLAWLAATLAIFIVPTTARAETDHVGHKHTSIRITSGRLHPEPVTLASDNALVFLNYSGRIAQISFDESVAENISCKTRTSFEVINGRLTAANVRQGAFTSLCQLAPGSYEYRVELKRSLGELDNYAVHEGVIPNHVRPGAESRASAASLRSCSAT